MIGQKPRGSSFEKIAFFFRNLSFVEFIQWRIAGLLKVRNKRKIYTYKFLDERFNNRDKLTTKHGFFKVAVKVNGDKDVYLRKFTSDVQVFQQIFLEKEFERVVHLFTTRNFKPTYILDGGANIGLSTLYLHSFYPAAEFVLVEPNDNNYKLLRKNMVVNKLDIASFNVALWHEETNLSIVSNELGDEWGFSVGYNNGSNQVHIKGVTIQSILQQLNWPYIDYLKLDIEGAEEELFKSKQSCDDILKNTNAISIEAHSQKFKEEFKKLLSDEYKFQVYEFGELLVGMKESLSYRS